MFKVLIVDSELFFASVVRELVNWETYGMQVVAIADDGHRALQLVQDKKPDLIIVNVHMRGPDGGLFMDCVRKFNSSVKLIAISAQRHFAYAKYAIRNNVENFLLKPINKSELEQTLCRVKQKLTEQQTKENTRKSLERELLKSRQKIQADLIKDMINGTWSLSAEDISRMNRQCSTCFFDTLTEGMFLLFSFHMETETLTEAEEYLNKMEEELRAEIGTVCEHFICLSEEKYILCLSNYRFENQNILFEYLKQKHQKWNYGCLSANRLPVTLCLGTGFSCLEHIKEAHQSLVDGWNCRVAVGIGKVIDTKFIVKSPSVIHKIQWPATEILYKHLKEQNLQSLKLIIRDVFSKAFYLVREDALLYYRVYFRFVHITYRFFFDTGMTHLSFEEYERRFYQGFCGAQYESQIAEVIYHGICQIYIDNKQCGHQLEVPCLCVIKQYVAEHYKEHISQTEVAQIVNLDSSYISRLFKREEQIGFIDYVNRYRIEEAKKILGNIQYKVEEVACNTGFTNPRYFSKIFRRMVGMTPTEYRQIHATVDDKKKQSTEY